MTLEVISQSIYTKVLEQARIELSTPGSAVRLATKCATGLYASLLAILTSTFEIKGPISMFGSEQNKISVQNFRTLTVWAESFWMKVNWPICSKES